MHFRRVDAILPEIQEWIPLESSDFEDIEKIKAIDSFVYRFAKIQDRMGDKLFPAILKELQEYRESMALIDVLNRLEKLELLPVSDEWIDFRKLRNTLTHEYPDNKDEIAESISLSVEVYRKMKAIYHNMLKRTDIS
jgi:hypothetical protein